jgi:hypothetical protein
MSESLAWMSSWYNLPFLIPMVIGLAFIGVEIISGGLGDLLSLDFDADVDVDADVSPMWGGLNWIGLGVVPFTMLVEIMCVVFGGTGFMVNAIAHDMGPWVQSVSLLFALPAAFAVTPVVTKYTARAISAYIPQDESTLALPGAHLGEEGVVTTTVNDRIGEVRIQPYGGEPLFIRARSVGGSLHKDSAVLLVKYDDERKLYLAAPAV